MNDLPLSAATRQLLAAAKSDVPSSAARASVWAGVSGAVGGVAAAGATGASAAISGGSAATKVVAFSALFGGALTVGIASVLLQVGMAPAPPTGSTLNPHALAQRPVSAPIVPIAAPVMRGATVLDESAPAHTGGAVSPTAGAPGATTVTHPTVGHAHRRAKSRDDSLAREASLVAEARGALAVDDPRSALRAIREARALPSKQLVPEELAVEEQALRALGRNDEANGIDVMIRLQYPESALAP
jgi:hypothetical protein